MGAVMCSRKTAFAFSDELVSAVVRSAFTDSLRSCTCVVLLSLIHCCRSPANDRADAAKLGGSDGGLSHSFSPRCAPCLRFATNSDCVQRFARSPAHGNWLRTALRLLITLVSDKTVRSYGRSPRASFSLDVCRSHYSWYSLALLCRKIGVVC